MVCSAFVVPIAMPCAINAGQALAAAVNAIRLRNFASPGRRCRVPAHPGTPSPNGGHNQGPSKPRQYCRVAVRQSRLLAAADGCVLANLAFSKLPPSGLPAAQRPIVGRRLGGLTTKCWGRLGGTRAEIRAGAGCLAARALWRENPNHWRAVTSLDATIRVAQSKQHPSAPRSGCYCRSISTSSADDGPRRRPFLAFAPLVFRYVRIGDLVFTFAYHLEG